MTAVAFAAYKKRQINVWEGVCNCDIAGGHSAFDPFAPCLAPHLRVALEYCPNRQPALTYTDNFPYSKINYVTSQLHLTTPFTSKEINWNWFHSLVRTVLLSLTTNSVMENNSNWRHYGQKVEKITFLLRINSFFVCLQIRMSTYSKHMVTQHNNQERQS